MATLNHKPGLPDSGADAFLYLKTKRAGVLKGESTVPDHADEIQVQGWKWGVSSSSAIGHQSATSRRSYSALTIEKSIDSATTALLATLATNDEVVEAKLSMRRAGGEQETYFTILLKGARVTGLEHGFDAAGGTLETVTINFLKIEVEYRPQKTTGLRSGTMTFSDDLTPH